MQGFLPPILLTLTAPWSSLASRSSVLQARAALLVADAIGTRVAPRLPAAVALPPVAPDPVAPDPVAPEPVDVARLDATVPADPDGIRVVPYRPDETWALGRRVHPRVYDPFRAFPSRARHLGDLMYPREPGS